MDYSKEGSAAGAPVGVLGSRINPAVPLGVHPVYSTPYPILGGRYVFLIGGESLNGVSRLMDAWREFLQERGPALLDVPPDQISGGCKGCGG